MRTFLIYAAIGLCLALLVVFVDSDSYVLIRFGDKAIQITIFVAVLFLIFAFWLVQLLRILTLGSLGGWRHSWRKKRANTLLNSAVASYASRNWNTAYKQMVGLANTQPRPQPYVLLAADSAAQSGDLDLARETYLNALDQFPDNSFQIRLRLAYLEFLAGNISVSKNYCELLVQERKKDAEARLLEILIAEENADWRELQDLIQRVRAHKIALAQLPSIERRFLRLRLSENLGAPDLMSLSEFVSNSIGVPSDLVILIGQQLALKGKADLSEQFLRKQLSENWRQDVLSAYSEVEGKSHKPQIKFLEKRLASYPEDHSLIEVLLKLSNRSNDEKRVDKYQGKLDGLVIKDNELVEVSSA